jgi:hypothetical protein
MYPSHLRKIFTLAGVMCVSSPTAAEEVASRLNNVLEDAYGEGLLVENNAWILTEPALDMFALFVFDDDDEDW